MKEKILIFSLCVSVITVSSLLLYTYTTTNLKPFDVWIGGVYSYYVNMPVHFKVTSDNQLQITCDCMKLKNEVTATIKLTRKEREELIKLVDDVKQNANPEYYIAVDDVIFVYANIDGIKYETIYEMGMGGEAVYNKQVERLVHKLIQLSPVDVLKKRKVEGVVIPTETEG